MRQRVDTAFYVRLSSGRQERVFAEQKYIECALYPSITVIRRVVQEKEPVCFVRP